MGRIIRVKVTPKSSKPGVTGYKHGVLEVRVSSPPIRGEANKELLGILSDHFGIAMRSMRIVSGERSKLKTVLIEE